MTPEQEIKLGHAMWEFERHQCVLGKRDPLPCTPHVGKVTCISMGVEDLKSKLIPIYRTITPELLDRCIPNRTSDRLIDIFMKSWERIKEEDMADEDPSSL